MSPKEVLFEGSAKSVMVPGEEGVFEVLAFHKPILSRLVFGTVVVDGKELPIKRGIMKAARNKVVVVIEER